MIKYYNAQGELQESKDAVAKVVTYGHLGDFIKEVMQCAKDGYEFSDHVSDYPRSSVGQYQATFRLASQVAQVAENETKRKTKRE